MFLKYTVNKDISAAKLYCTDTMDTKLDTGDITMSYLGFGEMFGVAQNWGMVKGTISLRTVDESESEAKIAHESGFGTVIYSLVREGGMWKISEIEGLDISMSEVEDMIKDAVDEGMAAIEGTP
jgi:hypothetical protein